MRIPFHFVLSLNSISLLTLLAFSAMSNEWEATLTATSNDKDVAVQVLIFKTVIGATDGFDNGHDAPAPPKAPPPVKLDVFFPVAGNPFITRLKTDARAPAELISWQFRLQADESDGNLSWDVNQVPPGYDITLANGATNLDIRETTSIPYVVGTTIYTVTVKEMAIPTNDAPLAESQSVATDEDMAVTITLTGSNEDRDDLTYQVVNQPTHGVLAGTAPDLTYTPVADYHGEDSFTFQVSDGILNSETVTVTITVNMVNDAPTANDLYLSTDEDTIVPMLLSGGDIDGDSLVYAVVAKPASGSLSGTEPELIYTPSVDYHGEDSFTFQTSDGILNSTTATVTITVNMVNDAPTANDLYLSTDEDTIVPMLLSGGDIDGDSLVYEVVAQPVSGSLSGTESELIYTPSVDYHGEDSFTFQTSDGVLNSATATVTITVNPVNDAPTANDLSLSTDENTVLAVSLAGSDVEGDSLFYKVMTQPVSGSLSGTESELIYTPSVDYHGEDSFTFQASDGVLNSTTATVNITIRRVNKVPVATDQTVVTEEDQAVPIILLGFDEDQDQLVYEVVEPPAYGNLSGTAPELTYTPQADHHGADYLVFRVNDGITDSQLATVNLTVTPVNDAPITIAATLETVEDHSLEIKLQATDVDNDNLDYLLLTLPTNGQLSTIADGTLTYTADSDYHGTDQFIFTVSDGTLSSEKSVVEINVTPVNDPPIALSQIGQQRVALKSESVAIYLQGQDVDGDEVSYLIVDPPQFGQLSGDGPNRIYNPGNGFTGSDQFTFRVNDGTTDSGLAKVEIVRPLLPFTFKVEDGISLVHLPLAVRLVNGQPRKIESISDLFDVLGADDNVSLLITYSKADKSWISYLGPRNRGRRADKPITPDLGIIAVMKESVTLNLLGEPLVVEGKAEIELQRGLNLIGLPVRDQRIRRPSDLFSLPEFDKSVTALIVAAGSDFKVLARAGDSGDFELTGAEALIVIAKTNAVIVLKGKGWTTDTSVSVD